MRDCHRQTWFLKSPDQRPYYQPPRPGSASSFANIAMTSINRNFFRRQRGFGAAFGVSAFRGFKLEYLGNSGHRPCLSSARHISQSQGEVCRLAGPESRARPRVTRPHRQKRKNPPKNVLWQRRRHTAAAVARQASQPAGISAHHHQSLENGKSCRRNRDPYVRRRFDTKP